MSALGIGVGVAFTRRGGANQAPPGSPINTAKPVISGTPQQGQTLTVSNGTWTNSPTSYSYEWRRSGFGVVSTAQSYTLVAADVGQTIACTVRATNANGTNYANADNVGPVTAANAAPVNTAAPVISGTGTQGQTLTTTNGTWTGNPTPTYTYQWRRDGAAISGATSASYALQAADVGATITCAVTGTNSAGSATAVSNGVGPIAAAATAPAQMAAPTLSAGNQSIAVTRAADPSNGGSAITGYDLRYGTDGTNWTTVAMTTNPQTISGLTNGTAYQVQTRAVNAIAPGTFSPSATATPTAGQAGAFMTDDFNRPDDATSLVLGAPDKWEFAGGGGGNSMAKVRNNNLVVGANDTAFRALPDLGSVNMAVEADITLPATNNNGPFLCVKFLDNNNWIGVRFNTSTGAVQCFRRIGGAFTQFATGTASAPMTGSRLRLEAVGTRFQLLQNSTIIVTPTETGDSGGVLTNATGTGFNPRTSAYSDNWIDNWRSETITAFRT